MTGGLTLTAIEAQVLAAWSGTCADYSYLTFRQVAERSGVARAEVRSVVRSLAQKGLVEYGRGLCTDDGEFFGSGYGLTAEGRAYLYARAAS